MDRKVKEKRIESRFSDKCRKEIVRKIRTLNMSEIVKIIEFLACLQDYFTEDDFKFMFSHFNKRAKMLMEREAESKKDCSVDQCEKYDKRRREYRDNKK